MCSDAYNAVMYDKDTNPVKLPGYRVDALTDAAIRFVDRNQKEPFYLFVSYLEPHFQNHRDDYPAPDGYEERYRGRWLPPDLATLGGSAHRHTPGYYGMIKRLDEAYGRLLDALKSLNLLDDTIVVFTSDHGNHFKTRNGEYKRSCHDSSLRLPTVITGPGFMQGGELRQLTSLIDLPPTVLDAAGIPVPQVMEGHSIMPLVRRESIKWQDSIFAQISEAQVGRCVRTHHWKYSVVAKDMDPGKDPASDTYEEEFLYDLMADPYELNNLLGLESHQKVAEVMRGRLLRWIKEVEGVQPQIITAPVRPSFQYRVTEEECYQ
jgi:arylsulfatase A-like enzyme